MSLMRRWMEPGEEIRRLRDSIGGLIDDFFGGRSVFPALRREGALAPQVDVYETGDEIVVKAEVPGVDKEHLDISLTEQELTLKGEVKKDEEVREEGYYRRERRYGVFSRTLPLPAPVETEGAKASFREGVMEIRIPKTAEERQKVKKITIE